MFFGTRKQQELRNWIDQTLGVAALLHKLVADFFQRASSAGRRPEVSVRATWRHCRQYRDPQSASD
jgi:hypothetical protein